MNLDPGVEIAIAQSHCETKASETRENSQSGKSERNVMKILLAAFYPTPSPLHSSTLSVDFDLGS